MIAYSESDVNRDLAYNAHRGTSWVPEKRADGVINDYLNEMADVIKAFAKFVTDENRGSLSADLEAYRVGYLKRLHEYLAAHSRVISPMITGPANFPTRTNEKRWRSADKRRDEWLEWRKKTRARLRRKYDPVAVARAPISSADDDAITKLQTKIEKAEARQQLMKDANATIRRGRKKNLDDEVLVPLLSELDGISETTARKLLTPDYMGKVGFPSYVLKNNNANIRRMKARIEQIQRERNRAPVDDVETAAGVTVKENREVNRLQVIFPSKPPAEVRSLLKSNGFRWAPSQVAWQRLLNDNARHAWARIASKVEELLQKED